MAAADADRADRLAVDADRIAAAENDEARRVDDAVQQRRIVLDEIVPTVGGDAKGGGGIGLVRRDLDRQQRGAVHAAERFEVARVIDDGDNHRDIYLEIGRASCRERGCQYV